MERDFFLADQFTPSLGITSAAPESKPATSLIVFPSNSRMLLKEGRSPEEPALPLGSSALSRIHPPLPITPLSRSDSLSMSDYTKWLNASHASRDDDVFAELYAELQLIARGRMASPMPASAG